MNDTVKKLGMFLPTGGKKRIRALQCVRRLGRRQDNPTGRKLSQHPGPGIDSEEPGVRPFALRIAPYLHVSHKRCCLSLGHDTRLQSGRFFQRNHQAFDINRMPSQHGITKSSGHLVEIFCGGIPAMNDSETDLPDGTGLVSGIVFSVIVWLFIAEIFLAFWDR